MPYINLDVDYFEHLKTVRLVGLLGKGSEALPIRLWCRVAKFHGDSGMLADYSAQEIESLVGWWGNSGEMVEAMLKVGFLERSGDAYKMHGWHERQGHVAAFHERARAGAEARWGKLRRKNASSNAKTLPKQSPYLPTVPTNLPTNLQVPDALKVDKPLIEKWLAYLAERGKGYPGPVQLDAFFKKLLELGPGRAAAIEYSMANGWLSIHQDKDVKKDEVPSYWTPLEKS